MSQPIKVVDGVLVVVINVVLLGKNELSCGWVEVVTKSLLYI